MKTIGTLILFVSVFALPLIAGAHGEEMFAQAEALITSKVPCEQLSDDQLEMMGDYYMEKMHPGEAHEVMDEMMGGEGSSSLRQVHINMARSFYCGESGAMSSSMMDVMMGRGGVTMGYGGMMNSTGGSMLPFSFSGMGYNFVFMFLFWFLVIGFVIWVIAKYTVSQKAGEKESAMEILNRRYAKGEITKNQFEEMKNELLKIKIPRA